MSNRDNHRRTLPAGNFRQIHSPTRALSGRRHAGESLQAVLRRQATDLPPPIQMCDALSRNRPRELQTIVADCLAHARRQFVDVNERFPAECRYVLEAFEVVCRNDQLACEDRLTPEERLHFHQQHSGLRWQTPAAYAAQLERQAGVFPAATRVESPVGAAPLPPTQHAN